MQLERDNWGVLVLLFAALEMALVVASPAQVLFSTSPHAVNVQWTDLNEPPNPNTTSNNILFDTVNNLLQHWPNTRYRNGHTITPGTVAVGSLLFHGRSDPYLPTNPEWTATDPEHAYFFCGSTGFPSNKTDPPPPEWPTGNGCWQLTIVTTRPLNVIYFDGSSAANMKDGTLDTQDILAWGKAKPDRWLDERERIDDLCAWGKIYGVDGFLRMEMDFEIMLCDFSSGVELLSADFLATWWNPYVVQDPRMARQALPHSSATSFIRPSSSHPIKITPPDEPTRNRIIQTIQFQPLLAGSWHNHFPGDLRVTLDYTRLVSFYDIEPSQSTERWDHRAGDVSQNDIRRLKERLESSLLHVDSGSGVDWRALYRGVIDRWGQRLALLELMLKADEEAIVIQRHLRLMLTPYTLLSVRPNTTSHWAAPVWQLCATRSTAYIHSSLSQRLTLSERTLLRAVDDTNREICRQVVRMWSWGVESGVDTLVVMPEAEQPHDTLWLFRHWNRATGELMQWLDWSVWVKCKPACGEQEMCYLPTWPYFWARLRDPEIQKGPWRRPQPRCIRAYEPYSDLSEVEDSED
ncbi:hypothetical protein MIND_00898900 [Mycena indigotica]|uniref:Uncharacterized protein n=1 Tax=Mycena indigotica TaxID=2126181 RepID=A0A8H6SH60_9AGAR|nr:uncharacterized protein MIND_00898900 [Mycena indigotica]KAF7299488.1 hypothetical protein MIND_00898900 [Mycena indigotica]